MPDNFYTPIIVVLLAWQLIALWVIAVRLGRIVTALEKRPACAGGSRDEQI